MNHPNLTTLNLTERSHSHAEIKLRIQALLRQKQTLIKTGNAATNKTYVKWVIFKIEELNKDVARLEKEYQDSITFISFENDYLS